MKFYKKITKIALTLILGLGLSNFAIGQCVVPVITTIDNSGPICEGADLILSATGTIGGVSSSSVRMAGIGANAGNREFDEVFSSGDRTGSIERISEATFNTYASAAALRARYDVLLFTWASSTSLNAPWALIEEYLSLGGSVFWEDNNNIGDLAPGINGVQFEGSFGCNYVLVDPAPFPVLVDNGVTPCFVNHHLKVNTFPTWMQAYIKGPAGENMAIAGIHPTGGGRIIVQGPDQDYHAVHGGIGTGANQYQFLLNQVDFLTAEQAGFSWTGPNGFTSNEANPVINNATTLNAGIYTATLTNLTGGGCSVTATTNAIVNAVPVITSIDNSGPICNGDDLILSATGTIGGVSSSSFRMAGIGANAGNREFNEVFSSGDRTGSIERISEATFNTYASAAALRARYDVLLFTWASSTSLNAPWALIEEYLSLGGSVFWEDNNNIGDLAPGINGVQFDGSFGCNYVLVDPAPFPVLVDNGVTPCFVNHHLKVNTFPTWMQAYIKGPAGENMAIAGIHPTGGGRIIVQGPDQDYHAVHGGTGTGANQYQFLLNQVDFLTSEQAGFSWTGPNGFTSNEANPVIANASNINAGVYTATLTNSENSSCIATATTTVLGDNVLPVAVCNNITVQLNNTGTASISASDVDGGSTDNCAIASLAVSPNSFDCSNIGANIVTLTVIDNSGNTATCNATVTIEDNVAPTAVCNNITVQLNGHGGAVIDATDVDGGSSDACGIASLSVSPSAFNCSNVGANTVTLTVTDNNGNVSTCNSTVTVEDNVAPITLCKNATVQLDATGNASITVADIDNGSFDLCGIASMSVSPNSFTCAEAGVNTVTLTVTDVNGNAGTCVASVSVEDNIAPLITCGADIFIDAERNDCTPVVTWEEPTASDNCTFTVTSNINSGAEFPVGTTAVNYTVTDASGNIAGCSFNVTVTPAPLLASLSAKTYEGGFNISCFGAADGEITPTVEGGCLPYTFNWSDGQTTEIATGLLAGNYTLTITDANGTEISEAISLTEPTPLVSEAGNNQTVYYGYGPFSCADLNGSSSGGVPAYSYAWSNGDASTATTVCPNVTTTYNFTVTDLNGCVAVDVVTICVIDVRCDNGGEAVLTEQGDKVMVCHKYDSKNAFSICIDSSAVAAHLEHGDRLGACEVEHSCFGETSGKASVTIENNNELENIDETFINVYPNPSTGKFNVVIESADLMNVSVSVSTLTGQNILQVNAQNQSGLVQLPIDLTAQSNGIYIVKVQFGQELVIKKIVINK